MYSFTEEIDDVSMHDMVALQSATINQLQQQVDPFKNDSAALKAASEVQQADLAEIKQKIYVCIYIYTTTTTTTQCKLQCVPICLCAH